MSYGIENKVALVTGGSYGIGFAIAASLAHHGCKVAICARGKERLEGAAKEIGGLAIQGDVTEPDDIERIVNVCGPMDILINNVGGAQGDAEEIIDKNMSAAVNFTRKALRFMKKSKWGRVVTIASRQGREGGGNEFYNMAKSAQISFMKTLAMNPEYARYGITLNSVAPGRTIFPGSEWDIFKRDEPEEFANSMVNSPLGRCGTPEEIANVVSFLCSLQASLVNGACIAVDGGESYSF